MNRVYVESDYVRVKEHDVIEFVTQRFSQLKKSKRINKLVEFQAMNKYMLMAHNQEELKILGNLVASHKKVPLPEIMNKYEMHLNLALAKKPTTKTHLNVIMHIFGHFGKCFSQPEKDLFFDLVKKFKEGEITLGRILSEISSIIYRFNNTYLAMQTYFLLYADTRPGILFRSLGSNLKRKELPLDS